MAVKVRDDIRSLSGAEKAAVVILSLGEEQASRIFSHMNDDEIKELSQVMANLGNVSSNL
ncbi:MAG: flagellar motor switch protein FliG, partial [Alphaproteobacteria bacterium]|nr:flagellar motor switch protein FliG [Alphaproteobacteria bacterium]